MIVGRHEANVVLKDNDLRSRISLRPDDAREVLKILKKDSNLLGELGVLDYRCRYASNLLEFILFQSACWCKKGEI